MSALVWMALSGSGMILLMLLVRALLGTRLHPRLLYALWLPVILCLLVPLRVPVPFWTPAAQAERVFQTIDRERPVVSETRPQPQDAETTGPAVPSATAAAQAGSSQAVRPAAQGNGAVSPARAPGWGSAVRWVYLIGALTVFLYIFFVNLRFRLRLRRARVPANVPRSLAPLVGGLRVYSAQCVPSPCLVGVLRPYIVVTPDATLDSACLRHVLVHERCHLRQGAPVVALLRGAALVLHWYNPLVWLAASLSRADGENACDAAAIALLGEAERLEYGRTLVTFLRARPAASHLVNTATTMAQSKKQLRRRIALIAEKRHLPVLAAALAVLLTLSGCTALVARTQSGAQAALADSSAVSGAQAAVTGSPAVSETVPVGRIPTLAPGYLQSVTAQTPQPTPTPTPDTRPGPGPLRALMDDYEAALAQEAPVSFENLSVEAVEAFLPDLPPDFKAWGRQLSTGGAYALLYLPTRPYSGPATEQMLTTYAHSTLEADGQWHTYQGIDVIVTTPFGYEQAAEYEFTVPEGYLTWVVSSECLLVAQADTPLVGPLAEYADDAETALKRFAAEHGLSTDEPDTGRYVAVYPIVPGSYAENIGLYYVPDAAFWETFDALCAEGPAAEVDRRSDAFWDTVHCAGSLYVESPDRGFEDYILTNDFVLHGWERIDNPELVRLLKDLAYDLTGVDLNAFDPAHLPALLSATLSFGGEVQTLNDAKSLETLRGMIVGADDLMGGAACPFGASLTLTLEDGQRLTLLVADDSCGTFSYGGLITLDYGRQERLLDLFGIAHP